MNKNDASQLSRWDKENTKIKTSSQLSSLSYLIPHHMHIHLILYDSLNPAHIPADTDICIGLISTGTVTHPARWSLRRHPLQIISEYVGISRCLADRVADRHASDTNKETHLRDAARYADLLEKIHTTYGDDIHLSLTQPTEPYMQTRRQQRCDRTTQRWRTYEIIDQPHTLISHDKFRAMYDDKPPIMEYFYRAMRRQTGYLMTDESSPPSHKTSKPLWGKRNLDAENRKFDRKLIEPARLTTPIIDAEREQAQALLARHDNSYELSTPRDALDHMPLSRTDALRCLSFFCENLLAGFGPHEDSMYEDQRLVHHSLLSHAINTRLLSVTEVVEQAIQTYHTRDDIPLNSIEGFVRQLIGRREYMYHRYLRYRDDIPHANVLDHRKKMPDYFRRQDTLAGQTTRLAHCVHRVTERVQQHAYSHHIERLMIIGNYCLLMGYDPRDVTKRFREMYIDAYERVVIPNVMGMSQFADGGNLATKPYVSSANYITKMSTFCTHCRYDPKAKTWPDACPITPLYRRFVDRHREHFGRQPYIIKHLATKDRDEIDEQIQSYEWEWEWEWER